MDTNCKRNELFLSAAVELAMSHGVFFAAALLRDVGVPLEAALSALTRMRTVEQLGRFQSARE